MSILKNFVLIAGGAAAGYLASRVAKTPVIGSDIELKQQAPLQKFLSQGGTMTQFFDSKYGRPFKHTALRTLRFAATVKAGMDEKEAELRERFEKQTQDTRPGSLDNWKTEREHNGSQDIIESETLPELDSERRVRRDAALGKDFFESSK